MDEYTRVSKDRAASKKTANPISRFDSRIACRGLDIYRQLVNHANYIFSQRQQSHPDPHWIAVGHKYYLAASKRIIDHNKETTCKIN
jgi:hypothetical protein